MNVLKSKTLHQVKTAQIALTVMSVPLALLYIVLPVMASQIGHEFNLDHLIFPYSIASCLTVLAIHVFISAVWKIVSFIRIGSFYSMPVERWVKVAKFAAIVGCAMPILVGLHLMIFENSGGPLMAAFVLGVVTIAITGAALLDLLVELYRDASSNIAELAEVI